MLTQYMEEVLAKLPRYADTGQPFIPVVDEAFVACWTGDSREDAHPDGLLASKIFMGYVEREKPHELYFCIGETLVWEVGSPNVAYSTAEAATEAARNQPPGWKKNET